MYIQTVSFAKFDSTPIHMYGWLNGGLKTILQLMHCWTYAISSTEV